MIRRVVSTALAGLALCAPVALRAQLPIPSLGVVGGVSHYSLNGSGSTAFGAVRANIPLLAIVAEGSLGAFRPDENGTTRTYVIPEVQLQYQLLPMIVRPYIGAGIGWFKGITGPDPKRDDMTISASAGVRLSVPLLPIGVQAEARFRSISGGGHATELTIGGHL